MPIYRLGELSPQLQEGVWVADNATIIGDVHLGRNVNVWFGAILRGDNDPITIGDNTNVQDAAVLHTDDGRMRNSISARSMRRIASPGVGAQAVTFSSSES